MPLTPRLFVLKIQNANFEIRNLKPDTGDVIRDAGTAIWVQVARNRNAETRCGLSISYPPHRISSLDTRHLSNEKMVFQSFFMLMTVQPFFFASSYSAWVKVPTLVLGSPCAGP